MNDPAHFFCPATQTLSAIFPAPSLALHEPNGLLAVGGTLNSTTLRAAYQQGIFPWYSVGQPILWWSPDPRAIIWPRKFHVSQSLRRTLRQRPWCITIDRAFVQVIAACAAPRANATGTWLSAEMIQAYNALHRQGLAHSVECWLDGELAGGVYGVAVGNIFCGESMFSKVTDGSKVALYALCRRLAAWGYQLLDCQVANPHLQTLGAENIARQRFCELLNAADNPCTVANDAWQESAEGVRVI